MTLLKLPRKEMATYVFKYTKNAIYHLTCTKNAYKKYFHRMDIPTTEPFSVMDVGVGDGRVLFDILNPLLPSNCKEIIGTDIDASMIEYCNKINKQEHVKFIQFDVAADGIPGSLENRFSVIFSSFCFMYVRNLRMALYNCKSMLKSNGELLLVFISKKNPLYTTYAEMCKMDIWKPFMKDFEGFVPHFSSQDPNREVTKLFEQVDMELLGKEFNHDLHFEAKRRNFLETFSSMDFVYRKIPKEKQEAYRRDFKAIFSAVSGVSMLEDNLDEPVSMNIPVVIIHGKKLS